MKWLQGCGTAVVATFLLLGNGQAETLPQAVEQIIRTNPDVRTVVYNRLGRDEEVVQSRSMYFPKVDVQAGVGVEEYTEPNDRSLDPWEVVLSLRQNVFAGMSSVNEVDRQEARVRSAAYRLRGVCENVALKVGKAYVEVLRGRELVALAKENQQIHEKIADQVALRSESGVSRMADTDQIQGRLALAKSNTVVTEINLLDAETNYQALVGHMPEDLEKPQPLDSCIPNDLEYLEKHAYENNPVLKSARADLNARKYQNKVAKSPFMPVIDVEVDKYWGEDVDAVEGETEYLAAWLRLRYNIFNGWNDKARKRETVELINEAREIRNHTNRQVVESVRLSWRAYQAVNERIKYLEERVKATSATAEAYSKQFTIGQRTLLDVLDTEAEVIDARKDLLNAGYDYLYAQYRILSGMGSLVRSLGLAYPDEAMVDDEDAEDAENAENNGGAEQAGEGNQQI